MDAAPTLRANLDRILGKALSALEPDATFLTLVLIKRH
jgi:hypothetical protein